jgi:sterol desaturase/sphingolipid hydroxylase (fatty acid hydroxylase superfamily)
MPRSDRHRQVPAGLARLLGDLLDALLPGLYPLAVGGGLAVYLACQAIGGPTAAALTAWSALMLALAAGLERLRPFDPRWQQPDAGASAWADGLSAAVLLGFLEPLLKAGLPLLAEVLREHLPTALRWPLQEIAIGWQILAALLWMELAKYGSHRLHHEWRGLWALHAMHHAPTRLYWLNNLRLHPLNHLLNSVASLLPLLAMGVPADVMLGALALTQPVVMLQHANVRTRNGWLDAVLSTNAAHRWHHGSRHAEAHANYGSALLLWDHVFGTYRPASADSRPHAVGLFDTHARYPARGSYLQQLLAPLLPPCCRPSAS